MWYYCYIKWAHWELNPGLVYAVYAAHLRINQCECTGLGSGRSAGRSTSAVLLENQHNARVNNVDTAREGPQHLVGARGVGRLAKDLAVVGNNSVGGDDQVEGLRILKRRGAGWHWPASLLRTCPADAEGGDIQVR